MPERMRIEEAPGFTEEINGDGTKRERRARAQHEERWQEESGLYVRVDNEASLFLYQALQLFPLQLLLFSTRCMKDYCFPIGKRTHLDVRITWSSI